MKKEHKIRIAVIFGGQSAEHEVSIRSARNVVTALDPQRYLVTLVAIDRYGNWIQYTERMLFDDKRSCIVMQEEKKTDERSAIPFVRDGKFYIRRGSRNTRIDVVFPVLHGPFGEDGAIQGLLKMYNVPFVGPGILGSAIGMDKDVAKRLLIHAGIKTAKFMMYRIHDKKRIAYDDVARELGSTVFVKPANLGSSVGISKAANDKEFRRAVAHAFAYDTKIVVEEFIKGKEIECAVIGDHDLHASILGEIVPQYDFYTYTAKYLDENGAIIVIPAFVKPVIAAQIREIAKRVCDVLECRGMSRVDFFVTDEDDIYVNEVNTIPGFTSISLFPQLLAQEGMTTKKIVDRLIKIAFARFAREKKLCID